MLNCSSLLTLLVFSLIEQGSSNVMLSSTNQTLTRHSLSLCIVEACRRFFSTDFETITFSQPLAQVNANVQSSIMVSHILLPLLGEENRWTFFIKNLLDFSTSTPHEKSYSYIIQIRKEGELAENVKRLKKFFSWNPHAKFLVMSPTVFSNPRRMAVKAIRVLWEHNVINAAVLLVNGKDMKRYDVYTWEPYSNSSCADNFGTTRAVDSCSFGIIEGDRSWFEEKISKKLYNCSVKVNYIKWPPYMKEVTNGLQYWISRFNSGSDFVVIFIYSINNTFVLVFSFSLTSAPPIFCYDPTNIPSI
ncbi:hypothetical protein NQ318_013528 [Aromia moschata]|uniref:Receptor ligand binding region domain-containing protein n=1 Tax=Aromia moschata TaxID=1265417 RepID=A0AAV8YC93_9CUCU|nr:hypothetical protein NQ318_013528 [Aromia moschata]